MRSSAAVAGLGRTGRHADDCLRPGDSTAAASGRERAAASGSEPALDLLYVEDNAANVQLLGEVLGGDYRTKAATSGERARPVN